MSESQKKSGAEAWPHAPQAGEEVELAQGTHVEIGRGWMTKFCVYYGWDEEQGRHMFMDRETKGGPVPRRWLLDDASLRRGVRTGQIRRIPNSWDAPGLVLVVPDNPPVYRHARPPAPACVDVNTGTATARKAIVAWARRRGTFTWEQIKSAALCSTGRLGVLVGDLVRDGLLTRCRVGVYRWRGGGK